MDGISLPYLERLLLIAQTVSGEVVSQEILEQAASTNYVKSFLAPNVNIGKGGSWSISLDFSLQEAVNVDSLDFTLFTFAGGRPQTDSRKGKYTLTLKSKLDGNFLLNVSNDVIYRGTSSYNSSGSAVADITNLGNGTSGLAASSSLETPLSLEGGIIPLSFLCRKIMNRMDILRGLGLLD